MRIGIDIGGTFTDFFLLNELTGEFHTYKRLSTPKNPSHAVLYGLQELEIHERFSIIHGSTVATNALLERKGAETALITTKGFRDLLAIGRQTRAELYDLCPQRPKPLVSQEKCFEVTERVNAQGQVMIELDETQITDLIEALPEDVESVAICLLFSFLRPEHEQKITKVLRQAGFFVSPSSEILPEFREFERASTTTINAYVSPILDRYLKDLEQKLDLDNFSIMQSNGGSIRVEEARLEAVRSILSGPAGGVVGAFHVAQLAGYNQVISFDMGGTSTDVCLSDGEIRVTTEAEIDHLPIRIPVIDVHSVGSGGGSIASVDAGGALRVGPQSAGADPGPACYAQGGEHPTVTDANLILGRLLPDRFLGGRMPLDFQKADHVLSKLAEDAGLTGRDGLSPAQVAGLGIIEVVNAHMERALRVISVERGYDPVDFTLVSFGGAGGLHAVNLAQALGAARVLVPPGASTLSAFGMLTADVVKDYVQTVMLPGDTPYEEIAKLMDPMIDRGTSDVQNEGIHRDQIQVQPAIDMRYVGQGYELTLPLSPNFVADFHRSHQHAYGHKTTSAPVKIVNLRIRVVGRLPQPQLDRSAQASEDPSLAYIEDREFVNEAGAVISGTCYQGSQLMPGNLLQGPALLIYTDTTIFLPHGHQAEVDEYRNLIIEKERIT